MIFCISVTFDNTSTGLSSHLKWNQDEIRGKEVYSDVKFLMKMLELGIKYCEIHSKLHEQEYLKTKLEVFDCFLNHTFLNNTEGMLKYDKTKLLKSIFSLNDYINTVIFIFGIMVNMFGIVIIMQHKSYKPGFSVLIAILLLTDASFIFWRVGFELLIFLNWEYHYIYMFYIDGIVEYYYIASFITNILQQFEACLIAFLSAKRTLSIFAGKINDSVKNTVIAILFIFLIVVLLNLPALFFPNFSCNSSSKYNYISILYSKCQVWFSLVAGACIPYSVILLCNFSLIVHMLISYVHHSNTTFSETKNTNNVGRAVFLLFCVSTSFSAFTLPFYIHLIQYNSHSYAGLYEKHDNTFFYIQTGSYVVFKALFNLNFCANFFFYCVSSEKFRADIKKLVIPKCFKSLHESET